VIAAVVAFAIGWIALMSIKTAGNATDVPRYRAYGEAIRHGHVPYRDFRVEYPPGSLLAFVLPALAATGYRGYRIAFEVLMGLCGIGLIVVTALVLVRLRARIAPSLAFVAAAIPALGPITLGHFDLLPALFVSATLAALVWERPRTAAVLLGLAIATKIYALVLVPVAAVWIWRRLGRRQTEVWLGTTAATVLACFLPFVILSPGGVLWSLSDQAGRPLQLESSAAAGLLAAHQLFSLPLGVEFSHTSANLGGQNAAVAGAATVAAEILVLLSVWIAFARGRGDLRGLARSSTTAVFAFVLLGKVFSPQFLLWLIPLVPLVGGMLALGGSAGLGLSILLTRAYFPGRWSDLIGFEALPTWLLVARDGVLLAVLAALLVAERRRSRDVAREGSPTPTARSQPSTLQLLR
jgi:hypothetical protein